MIPEVTFGDYLLVIFPDENHWNDDATKAIEIIPRKWIRSCVDKLVALYPEPDSKGSYTVKFRREIQNNIKKQIEPRSEWPEYNIDIRGEAS